MSYGQWAPNWRTWRNWQNETATSSAGNWQQVPAAPTWNVWQTGLAPPPPPLTMTLLPARRPLPQPVPWQNGVAPLRNWYTRPPAPYWTRQNEMATMGVWQTPFQYWNELATRDVWRTGDIIGNWLTELARERNPHLGPNHYLPSWQQAELEYGSLFPFHLSRLPAALANIGPVWDPWRPLEEGRPLLLTGLQEAQELPEQGQMEMAAQAEQRRLSRTERRAALRSLKKKTYSNALEPKREGDNVGDDVHETNKKHKDQETTETCTVCLEDFKPEEEVMVTPCNHIFHEDCLVPWVKSHAQCPICRLKLGRSATNSNQPQR